MELKRHLHLAHCPCDSHVARKALGAWLRSRPFGRAISPLSEWGTQEPHVPPCPGHRNLAARPVADLGPSFPFSSAFTVKLGPRGAYIPLHLLDSAGGWAITF